MVAKEALKRERVCLECGAHFSTYRREASYCSRACKDAAANREASRGKQLYRLAYNWRKGYGKTDVSKASLKDLSWLMDQFIREDREAGRQPPPPGPTDMTVSQSFMTRGEGAPRG